MNLRSDSHLWTGVSPAVAPHDPSSGRGGGAWRNEHEPVSRIRNKPELTSLRLVGAHGADVHCRLRLAEVIPA